MTQLADSMQKLKAPEMLYIIPAGTMVQLQSGVEPGSDLVTSHYRTKCKVTYEEEDLREIGELGMYRFELPDNDRNVVYLTVSKKHINEVSKPHYNYRRQHR